MKKLLFFPLIIFSFQSFASEQDKLTKWNTDVSKSIRNAHAEKLAQTTYREINVKDATVSNDLSKVYPQIETKVTKDGSATRVVAEAVLDTDKEKVAKDWAKKLNAAAKYGKGVLGGAALTIMVDQLLEAVDYVMGEGGQITKKPDITNPDDPRNQYKFYPTTASGAFTHIPRIYYTSVQAACAAYDAQREGSSGIATLIEITHSTVNTNRWFCRYSTSNNSSGTTVTVTRSNNSAYDPNAPEPERVPVSETELKDAIKSKVLNNPQKQNLAKEIVKDSYARIWDDKGNSMEIRGDVSNKQKDIVSSDNPKDDGHSTSTPTITDGKTGSGTTSSDSSTTGTSDGTTYNPDGSVSSTTTTTTTTNTSSSTKMEFSLPAFCDWATTVCDWLGWTQEQPELNDTPLEIEEREFTPYQFEEHVRFAQTCPFSPETVSLPMGAIGELEFQTDLTFICDWGHNARPYIQGLGYLGSLIFLLYGLRSGNG